MSEENTEIINPETTSEEVEEQVEDEVIDDLVSEESDEVIDDSEEVEHEGKKYRVPKELKSALMRQDDYTRKTQEVAEQRRQIEEHAQRVQRESVEHQEDIQDYARLVATNDRLAQFEQVDWTALADNDPVTAQKLWFEFTQLKEQRNQLGSNLTHRQQQRQYHAQQQTARQLEEGRAQLAREIKDWSPQLALELAAFAKADGWSDAEIERITPAQVKSLNRSYMGEKLLKSTPKAKPVDAKPVTQVSGVAKVKKDPARMTDAEFSAWRRSQIKNRR